MDELIKALKAALLKGGLTEDSEQFKNVIKPENFEGLKEQLEMKQPTTFEESLKIPGFQSAFDKKITDAIQSREANLKEKWDFVEKGKAPAVETAEQKAIRELQEQQTARDKADALKNKQTAAKTLLNSKKIPDAFLSHFDFNSETALEEQLKEVENTFTDIKQNIITSSIGNKLPLGKGENGEVSKEEADSIVARM